MLLMLAGDRGPRTNLLAALRELHDDAAEHTRKRIAARKAKGIPLDGAADWAAISERVEAIRAAALVLDAAAAREAAGFIHEALAGTLVEPEAFVADESVEGYEGVHVVARVLSDERATALRLEHDNAVVALLAESGEGLLPARSRVMAAKVAIVAACFASIEGLTRQDGSGIVLEAKDAAPIDGVEVLAGSDILSALMAVGLAFQRLPAKKAVRFGSSPQST